MAPSRRSACRRDRRSRKATSSPFSSDEEDAMSLELIRGLYDYHRWANHLLFDVARARGEEAVERDRGAQWSFPTVRRMFAHIYGADAIWLSRWKGNSLSALPGADIASMLALRERWDALEAEQRAFVDGLADRD